jgi:hypothetical protein
MTTGLDDYYVIVSRRGERPARWSWEIRRKSKPMGIKMTGDEFQSELGAQFAGSRALAIFLSDLLKRKTEVRPVRHKDEKNDGALSVPKRNIFETLIFEEPNSAIVGFLRCSFQRVFGTCRRGPAAAAKQGWPAHSRGTRTVVATPRWLNRSPAHHSVDCRPDHRQGGDSRVGFAAYDLVPHAVHQLRVKLPAPFAFAIVEQRIVDTAIFHGDSPSLA